MRAPYIPHFLPSKQGPPQLKTARARYPLGTGFGGRPADLRSSIPVSGPHSAQNDFVEESRTRDWLFGYNSFPLGLFRHRDTYE